MPCSEAKFLPKRCTASNTISLILLVIDSYYHTVDKSEAHLDYEPFRYREGSARFEAALENFPGFYGLEAAAKLHLALGPSRIQTHIRDLNDHAAERLQSMG